MFTNLGIKLLAIFFAIALWGAVAYTENPTQNHTYKLPVTESRLASALVVVGPAPQVPVTITATSDNLRAFQPSDLVVSGDFSKVKIGNNEVPVRVNNTDPSVQVDAPSTVAVVIDQLSTTTLNVSIDRVGALLPGYHEQPNTTSVTPSTAQVSGPKSKLNGIQAVAQVNLSQAAAPGINNTYPVIILDASNKTVNGLTVNPPNVTVKMVVVADAITVTKAVGFTITGQPAAGYRVTNVQISPLVVEATGLQNVLGGVTILSTDPVDISGQKADVIRIVTIRPPNGVALNQRTATVHVYISAIPGASPTPTPSSSTSP